MSARRGVVCPKADVDDVEVLDEINRLLATTNDTTVNTSIRLPAASTRLGRTECRPVRCCPLYHDQDHRRPPPGTRDAVQGWRARSSPSCRAGRPDLRRPPSPAGCLGLVSSGAVKEPRSERPHMPDYGVDVASWEPLAWSWAVERLTANRNFWFVTVSADGRPHALPVWGVWDEDINRFSFSCAPRARKARNLAENPRAVVMVDDTVECLSVEGLARRVLTFEGQERWIDRFLTKYRPISPGVDAGFLRQNLVFEFEPERALPSSNERRSSPPGLPAGSSRRDHACDRVSGMCLNQAEGFAPGSSTTLARVTPRWALRHSACSFTCRRVEADNSSDQAVTAP